MGMERQTLMSAPQLAATALKASPVGALDGISVAELGTILEIEVGDHVVRFSGNRYPLLWSPDKKTLLVQEGAKRGKKSTRDGGGRAGAAFERWSGRGATYERGDTFPTVRGARWWSVGAVRRIDYTSDKWGRRRVEYTHETGPGVRLYRYGGATKPPWVWAIKGGRMTVTARGIVH